MGKARGPAGPPGPPANSEPPTTSHVVTGTKFVPPGRSTPALPPTLSPQPPPYVVTGTDSASSVPGVCKRQPTQPSVVQGRSNVTRNFRDGALVSLEVAMHVLDDDRAFAHRRRDSPVGQLQTRENQCNSSLIERQPLGGGGGLLRGGGSGNFVVGRIAPLELARHTVEGLEVSW